jgi:FMN phosphatase YigB (HAD superfamily)
MILIDVGLTLLGGPTRSPATFITELLSLPQSTKPLISDIVFSQEHSTPDDLLDSLSTILKIEFSDAQRSSLIDYWVSQLDECLPLPGAQEFCKAIIENKYPYCIASNLWKPFHMALTRFIPEIEPSAKFLFLSYIMGARKPSDEFYNHVFLAIDAKPQNVVMVGDSFENDIFPCLSRGATCVMLDLADKLTDRSSIMERASTYPDAQLHIAKTHSECLDLLKTLV